MGEQLALTKRRRTAAAAGVGQSSALQETETELDPRAQQAPHLSTSAENVEYQIVIPTYRRWQPTIEVVGERRSRRFNNPEQPFILEHTLGFLSRQGIQRSRVTLFVAHDEEAINYKKALDKTEWSGVGIRVSAPGIRDSRNAICKYFSEGTYIVSLDDDIEGIRWKVVDSTAQQSLRWLPPGGFEKLIFDAHQRMKAKSAFLWGVSTSANVMSMTLSGVSVRNGLVNGYLHGFICRPHCADLLRTLTDAVEDCEFSVRHFANDGVVLRYKMYAGVTSPYKNGGGLQAQFEDKTSSDASSCAAAAALPETAVASNACSARKLEERRGAEELHRLFPRLIAKPLEQRSKCTMEVKFIRMGKETYRGVTKNGKFTRSVARKLKEKKTRRVYAFELRPEDCIKYEAKNIKKAGTKSFLRYETYQTAKTVGEAKELGAISEDLRCDPCMGCMQIVELNITPSSSECKVKDNSSLSEDTPAVASGKCSLVSVRTKEMKLKTCCLKLPREVLSLLARRGGASLRRCPASQWQGRHGPLADVPLDVVRILLHWAKTGILAYSLKRSVAVSDGLRSCGAVSLAEKARCREVATGQASLGRFFGKSAGPQGNLKEAEGCGTFQELLNLKKSKTECLGSPEPDTSVDGADSARKAPSRRKVQTPKAPLVQEDALATVSLGKLQTFKTEGVAEAVAQRTSGPEQSNLALFWRSSPRDALETVPCCKVAKEDLQRTQKRGGLQRPTENRSPVTPMRIIAEETLKKQDRLASAPCGIDEHQEADSAEPQASQLHTCPVESETDSMAPPQKRKRKLK